VIKVMTAEIRHRRVAFLLLNLVTLILFMAAMLALIVAGGMTLSEWIIGLGFMLTMPYTVIGFWNAAIGLWFRHRRLAMLHPMPGVAELRDSAPPLALACDTVLVMTLRNEAPAPVFNRLARMRASLAATGQLPRFTFAVLSDSDRVDVIDAEARAFTAFCDQRAVDEPQPIYRRRAHNRVYKAGNIDEFIDARGRVFDYFIPLDADSLMSGEVMVRMVAAMQARPGIGILQSLVVGMPSTSGFARVFQFGMRHGMRASTAGAAWWTADCGSYWGHNAVIRTAPFRQHCRLPELPGSPPLVGPVLSHDQLEAAFMRRAGYEVRVIPLESESYEINPPTLLDFIRRELRWCQGNMQYLRLLTTRGLKPVSRMQLFIAIGMYIAPAAWIGMLAAACVGAMTGGFRIGDLRLGVALFVGVFFLTVAPKLFGAVDVWLSEGGSARYGGPVVFATSVFMELVLSMLVAPIVALSIALFLIGLMFGQSMSWSGQNRDRLDMAWREALLVLTPHTLVGIALAAALWWVGGVMAAVWALPVIAGLALAVPYTVLSAKSALGRGLARLGLFGIPEEQNAPPILAV
jgi:membrane glycosyltransferase